MTALGNNQHNILLLRGLPLRRGWHAGKRYLAGADDARVNTRMRDRLPRDRPPRNISTINVWISPCCRAFPFCETCEGAGEPRVNARRIERTLCFIGFVAMGIFFKGPIWTLRHGKVDRTKCADYRIKLTGRIKDYFFRFLEIQRCNERWCFGGRMINSFMNQMNGEHFE